MNTADSFIAAVRAGRRGAVEQHLTSSSGLDINATDKEGETALMAASSKGDVGMVDMMLSQGAAVNQAANNGWTPLFYAAFGDHADVLRHLIAAGAHAEHPVERNQCTALGIAARVGNVAAVRTLVEHGADVCAKDWHRMAPIDYAWNDEVRQILQKEGDRRKAAALSVMPGEMHADVKQNIIDKLS